MPQRLGLVAVLAIIVLSLACSSGSKSAAGPDYTPEEKQVAAAIQASLARLRPEARDLVKSQSWFAEGKTEVPFQELLGAAATYYWSSDADEVSAFLTKYPNGMEPGTVSKLRILAAVAPIKQVLQRPWLEDGLDDYENGVLQSANPDATSRIWLLALDNIAFRDLYQTNPATFNEGVLVPLSKLTRGVLDYVAGQDWFNDGLDAGEASVLVSLWTVGAEKEQMQVLTGHQYAFARLSQTTTAILVVGPEVAAVLPHVGEVANVMKQVEAVWGPWPQHGMVIDTKALDANCHEQSVSSGSIYIARIVLSTTTSAAAGFCWSSGVIAHELTHAYFGAKNGVWFGEGVAELGSVVVTGARAGYTSPRSTNIRLYRDDLPILTSSPGYFDQASGGADFLVRVFRLIGRERMLDALKPLIGGKSSTETVLESLRKQAPPTAASELESLIAWFFDGVGKAPPPLPR